jgi:protein-L-isoaspartate(D-aspartate) O-methyltransferase
VSDNPRGAALADELRREGIRDEAVLSAMAAVPREYFVDSSFEGAAYENTALPIACGQTISQPYVVAYMTEILHVDARSHVLEIGTGSGYQAAVLSQLCRRVCTIERHRLLLQEAERRFKALHIENIASRLGDGYRGWPEQAPFDRILLTAAADNVPSALVDQLKPGGILVGPIGVAAQPFGGSEIFCQLLTKMIRSETGFTQEKLIPVVFVPMVAGVPESGSDHDGRDRKD